MRCENEGSGPVVVLLPALGCDGRMWAGVTRTLARRFTVLRPETADTGDLPTAAQAVVGLLSSQGISAVGLAGLSMGGYLAFEVLRSWPQGVRSAALLDTTAFADAPERRKKRRQVLRLLNEGRFDDVLDAFTASVLAPEHAGPGPARDLLLEMARRLGPDGFAHDVQAILQRGSYEDVLRLARVPLLFLAGEHDALSPPDVARRMARETPGARVAVVPGAGHMTALENPDEVARQLEAFFTETLGRG
ncbi:MAG: alpha/beta fold hydrolase [Deltaproteobacteria bacterium]|nr:alpha/beta fold hydrolase [Deltaproteobacteria bacterium]